MNFLKRRASSAASGHSPSIMGEQIWTCLRKLLKYLSSSFFLPLVEAPSTFTRTQTLVSLQSTSELKGQPWGLLLGGEVMEIKGQTQLAAALSAKKLPPPHCILLARLARASPPARLQSLEHQEALPMVGDLPLLYPSHRLLYLGSAGNLWNL